MSPRTKEQFAKMRVERSETIKKAAMELFSMYGFHATSISKIAQKAGVSKGLLYNYYESKEDLLHDLVNEIMEEMGSAYLEILQSELAAFKKLEAIVNMSVKMVKEQTRYWKLITAMVFKVDVMEKIKPDVEASQTKYFHHLIQMFEDLEVEDPAKEALFFGASLDGLFLQYLSGLESYPLDVMKDFLINKYRN